MTGRHATPDQPIDRLDDRRPVTFGFPALPDLCLMESDPIELRNLPLASCGRSLVLARSVPAARAIPRARPGRRPACDDEGKRGGARPSPAATHKRSPGLDRPRSPAAETPAARPIEPRQPAGAHCSNAFECPCASPASARLSATASRQPATSSSAASRSAALARLRAHPVEPSVNRSTQSASSRSRVTSSTAGYSSGSFADPRWSFGGPIARRRPSSDTVPRGRDVLRGTRELCGEPGALECARGTNATVQASVPARAGRVTTGRRPSGGRFGEASRRDLLRQRAARQRSS